MPAHSALEGGHVDAPAPNDPVSSLLYNLTGTLGDDLLQIDWAEAEIAQAMARQPAHRDAIFHSYSLLRPTHRFMMTEFVYRSHCRELLERVATGADTRPGTAAEVCCLCANISQQVPFSAAAAGLYLRMWATAFPDHPLGTERGQHHEALYKTRIDDLESEARHKLRVDHRALTSVSCEGFHHGEPVACTFSRPRIHAEE